jgi:hypothetical protein
VRFPARQPPPSGAIHASRSINHTAIPPLLRPDDRNRCAQRKFTGVLVESVTARLPAMAIIFSSNRRHRYRPGGSDGGPGQGINKSLLTRRLRCALAVEGEISPRRSSEPSTPGHPLSARIFSREASAIADATNAIARPATRRLQSAQQVLT